MTAVNSEKALENGEKNNAPEVPDENDKDSENESQVDDKELKVNFCQKLQSFFIRLLLNVFYQHYVIDCIWKK